MKPALVNGGFYWVKSLRSSKWVVAQYWKEYWLFCGNDEDSSVVYAIGERVFYNPNQVVFIEENVS